jgi:hypothetical protein
MLGINLYTTLAYAYSEEPKMMSKKLTKTKSVQKENWAEVLEFLATDKEVQRAVVGLSDYQNPVNIYYDSIQQAYIVEVLQWL